MQNNICNKYIQVSKANCHEVISFTDFLMEFDVLPEDSGTVLHVL